MRREQRRWALCGLVAMSLGFAQEEAGWRIRGRVVDARGPVARRFVSCQGPGLVPSTVVSGSDGSFVLEGRSAGLYTITVRPTEGAPGGVPRTMRMEAGQRLEGLELRIPSGGAISGRVVNERKEAVAGVLVAAVLPREPAGRRLWGATALAKTNERGEYRIGGLTPSRYLVAVESYPKPKLGRVGQGVRSGAPVLPPLTFYPSGRSGEGALPVQVKAGEESRGVDIAVRREVGHCLRIRPSGAGAGEGARVFLGGVEQLDREYVGAIPSVETQMGEESEVCGLAPGEYRIYSLVMNRGLRQALSNGFSTVVIGREDVDAGTLVLLAPVALGGTVRMRERGEALPAGLSIGLALRDRELTPGERLSARPDEGGRFEIPAVLVSEYAVRVSGLPGGYYVAAATQAGRDVRQGGLRPGEGPLQVELASNGATLEGRVLGPGDEARPEVSVIVRRKGGGDERVTRSDQSGRYWFEMGLEPGEYEVGALGARDEMGAVEAKALAAEVRRWVAVRLEARARRRLDLAE